ncbi:MAG: calcium/sodium antiporter [Phycisphaeraceae bacterium]|nr:calcium/sodium antiporter [Phycisphaeraceae bacterium]
MQYAGMFALGLVMLLIGGRLLVSASVQVATRLGVPPLLVGLTLVAWGTSAPELAFNLTAAATDRPALVLGNVIGANICNMGIVLGLMSLLRPLLVDSTVIRRELPIMVGLFVLMGAAILSPMAGLAGGRLGPALMLTAFLVYSVVVIRLGLRERDRDPLAGQTQQSEIMQASYPAWRLAVMFIAGLGLLSVGGNIAADAATGIAKVLGMSDRVVGLTVVSVGTTLPELVTSYLAIRKGQVDLAVGNAVGSCLFNVGAIYGLAGLIAPPGGGPEVLLSLATMTLMGVMLIPMSRTHSNSIARVEGAVLLLTQAAFVVVELLRSRG